MHEFSHHFLPSSFERYIVVDAENNYTIDTRHNHHIFKTKHRTTFSSKLPKHNFVTIWNGININDTVPKLISSSCYVRDFAKKTNSKNPRLLCKWSRSHSDFFCGKSSNNSPKAVLIFWSSIPCVFCTFLKVVGYYDLNYYLCMSLMI